jgi:cephalosporin hydroxylase
MKLQEIGTKTGTDKSTHSYKNINYLDIYHKHFEKNRLDVKVFVEIGILNGSSLRMWKEYFPNAIIYGIDIDPRCKSFEEDRIKIFIGDQNDDDFLNKIKSEISSIDILLDDGSHITNHQIKTFNYLHELIKNGGFYVIEDLRNSYEEFANPYDLRTSWPGMKYNKPEDDLKNYRKDFNEWVQGMIKKLDFHDNNNKICGIYHYPMIVIFENF